MSWRTKFLMALLASPLVLLDLLLLFARGSNLLHASELEEAMVGYGWPDQVRVVASDYDLRGPVSSNGCHFHAAAVLDGVDDVSALESLVGGRWLIEDDPHLEVEGEALSSSEPLKTLAADHPPQPGRVYVLDYDMSTSGFAFSWDLRCH